MQPLFLWSIPTGWFHQQRPVTADLLTMVLCGLWWSSHQEITALKVNRLHFRTRSVIYCNRLLWPSNFWPNLLLGTFEFLGNEMTSREEQYQTAPKYICTIRDCQPRAKLRFEWSHHRRQCVSRVPLSHNNRMNGAGGGYQLCSRIP